MQTPPRVQTLALIGNPNTGKTTLFNALTGLRQKVANYPGVTVEKKLGSGRDRHGNEFSVIDLPGAYSLDAKSPDEGVTRAVLRGERADTPRPDAVICLIDASNLERHFYLATQVMELGLLPGASIRLVRRAPLGCPIEFEVGGARLALRGTDAANIFIQ